jgi:hypothetical protein
MRWTHTHLRRLPLAALTVGLATAALGVFFLSMLPGSSRAAVTAAPVNTGEPTIRGTPRVGERLTSTLGAWTGSQPITFGRRWVRCGADGGLPNGSNCLAISDATSRRYTVREADAGSRLRVRVTATNADASTTVASNATAIVVAAPARPRNTTEPSISGSPVVGNRLTANPGAWTGDNPITYAFRWLRCNPSGGNCSEIAGATDNEYAVVSADASRTLRVRVTARNDAGTMSALSNPTGVVAQQPGSPPSSVPVTSVPRGERLIVSQVRFSPNPVTSRVAPISVSIRVLDTRGNLVRGALVFIRSVPRRTTGGNLQATAADGWVTYQLQPLGHFPAVNGNVQFFVKAYRAGDPPLAGIAGYRLVQVGVLTAGQQ